MTDFLGDRVENRRLTRRDFIRLAASSTAGFSLATGLSGCAVDPVTGEKSLVLMSEAQEVQVDRQQSPHQFSADYGESRDGTLNAYLSDVGHRLSRRSHRPNMPYSFRAVNATYVNAYAFPGGSVAVTRGILADIENEAELGGLLGHEVGHVNARHAAERATRQQVAGGLVGLANVAVAGSDYSGLAPLVQSLSGLGAGALLSHYSRDNEREADSLGMEYMHRAGLNPNGMVGLMDILRRESKHKPSALELMFATHPMSDERFATARQRAGGRYASARGVPMGREAYMDRTAAIRAMKGAIATLQRGEGQMRKKKYAQAEGSYRQALAQAPEDYAGLVMMSKCQIALDRPKRARSYAAKARRVNPREAQANHLLGISSMMQRDFESAFNSFNRYDRMLPGNPNTAFLKGVSLESMHQKKAAANEFRRYLRQVNRGDQAKYAYQRLKQWGYVK